jgi:hypothetical protein
MVAATQAEIEEYGCQPSRIKEKPVTDLINQRSGRIKGSLDQ